MVGLAVAEALCESAKMLGARSGAVVDAAPNGVRIDPEVGLGFAASRAFRVAWMGGDSGRWAATWSMASVPTSVPAPTIGGVALASSSELPVNDRNR
jgi:hypothetical protein